MTTNPVTPSHAKPGQVEACVTSPSAWRSPIAAAALALVLGFASTDAAALALGRVSVLSAIGEPLRAEIDVPQITPEEAASLTTAIAKPDAFRAAGLEYNAALTNAQISLQRRANGTAFLRLSSDRVINEPFVDLILEASWSSGRIVRDYTMLFDPANMRQAAAPSATTAAASPAAPAVAPAPAPQSAARPSAPAAPAAAAPRPARTEAAAKPATKSPAQPAEKSAPKDGVTVKPGDTAAALAARYKPSGVSLDQMLVAMLNASPDAFIGGNVNRLKSGAVIDMQAAGNAAPSTAEGDAKQTIVAQAKDFNEFRRRLASGAPTAAAAAPSRAAGGQVQANVSEPKAQATAPDKLTLSKGSVAAKAKEEQIAKEKQAKANEARVAELSKNISDLNKIGTTTVAKPGAPAAAAPAPAASAPGVKLATPAPSVPAIPTPTAAAPAPAASAAKPTATAAVSTPSVAVTTPSVAASSTPTAVSASTSTAAVTSTTATAAPPAPAPAPVAAAPKPQAPTPPPPPEPSFMESLLDNPALLPAAGGLLAGLGGLAFWRIRQKKKAAQVDSSFLESRLQPDSFFGASGGQRVDTADSGSAIGAGSSMVYSPSQLDAAGDVDPVAEADVYLAYGRDLQAEEILKEALRSNPSRVAIHAKLMEIYAKRRDVKAFETVAKEAFQLTQGQGTEWENASTLGRELDPSNPLYAQGNAMSGKGVAGSVMIGGAALAAKAAYDSSNTVPLNLNKEEQDSDIDFDLDFSASDMPVEGNPQGPTGMPMEPTVAMRASPEPEPMVDFDMSEPAALTSIKLSAPDMASLNDSLAFSSDSGFAASAPTAPMALKTGPSEPSSLEFDLGNLSLDLPGSTAASNAVDAGVSGDPLETKLALAAEFRDIGDADGARALVQEVADEATGTLKARAVKMLADLG
ncbi:MAG: fimbrial protein FimV [Burkholderiales bacterium]|nr:MAG: fimbrial protein FimV [Burkholderiales bacterium]